MCNTPFNALERSTPGEAETLTGLSAIPPVL